MKRKAAARSGKERVLIDVGEGSALSAEQTVIFSRTGQSRVIPGDLMKVLGACEGLEPISVHASTVQAHLAHPGAAAFVGQLLTLLKRNGFLLGERALVARAQARAESTRTAPARIEAFTVLTCNKVELAERAVRSFAKNFEAHGRAPRIVLSDDSRDLKMQADFRRSVAATAKKLPLELRYAGRAEKESFAVQLSRHTRVPEDVVRFALLGEPTAGPTAGASRNATLLETVGEPFLTADDDALCNAVVRHDTLPGLNFHQRGFSVPTEVAPTWEALETKGRRVEVDCLAIHEAPLGRSSAELTAENAAHPLRVIGNTRRFLSQILEGRGRVLGVNAGIFGDSGFEYPQYLLQLSGEARDAVMASESTFRASLRSRLLLRTGRRLTLAPAQMIQGTVMSLDNRTLLPPFFPVLHGDDACFAYLLGKTSPDAWVASLPWALTHDPQPPKRTAAAELSRVRNNLYILFQALVNTFGGDFLGSDPAERMRVMGRHLETLGKLEPGEFRLALREAMLEQHEAEIRDLEAMLVLYDRKPRFWAKAMDALVQSMRTFMVGPDFLTHPALRKGRSVEEALVLFQQLVQRYGTLLTVWPTHVDGARALKRKGVRVSQAS